MIGMIRNAKPRAVSSAWTGSGMKPKTSARKSTSTGTTVSASARAAAPHSHLFCFFMEKMEARRLRMLKEWKISTMDRVMNAMVTPSASALPAIMSAMSM